MDSESAPLLFLPLTFSPSDATSSATHLILTLFPEWKASDLDFIRFTDGITNTLLKCVHRVREIDPVTGKETSHIDESESVLLRAYGKGTNVLIDRDRECQTHYSLSKYSLAPELLARFNNGLIYRFIPGRVASVEDLSTKTVFTAVASRLGQWHSTIDLTKLSMNASLTGTRRRIAPGSGVPEIVESDDSDDDGLDPVPYEAGKSGLWGVLDHWIDALPENNAEQRDRKAKLQSELSWLTLDSGLNGIGEIVYGHCDLLHGNVIILPKNASKLKEVPHFMEVPSELSGDSQVTFIDYEYATPTERAFDIANHFAEWTGFECNYSYIPTSSARRDFITTYLRSYNHFKSGSSAESLEAQVEQVMGEVDQFRGIPGFYWGIWALIQAQISQIDFDYASYAELRLKEYWDWKDITNGTAEGELTMRETRWASQ